MRKVPPGIKVILGGAERSGSFTNATLLSCIEFSLYTKWRSKHCRGRRIARRSQCWSFLAVDEFMPGSKRIPQKCMSSCSTPLVYVARDSTGTVAAIERLPQCV
jgi:hypothetical protein